jgi:prepilin-type N-terminal cleavage/methylation domain-containing protein
MISRKKATEKKNTGGYTMIEVLLAMTIVSIGFLATSAMQITAIQGNTSARKTTEANDLAVIAMERLTSLEWEDEKLENGSHSDPSNPRNHIYQVTWTVEPGPRIQTKLISVTVEFPDRGGNKKIVLTYLKSNPNPGFL